MRAAACLGVLLLLCAQAARAERFTVENIEVEGIKKIAVGTVFSYLPINVGEELDTDRTPSIIRDLYATGFFDDVGLYRRGNVLVIRVVERPSIAEVNYSGNTSIEDEMFNQALEQLEMTRGRIFDRNKLEKLESELQQVYFSQGKYAARVDAEWRQLDADRVAIDIEISEGVSAKIKSINITGNASFPEEELRDVFQLETDSDGWFANDEYSSGQLSADLQALRSFYNDRGYIAFDVVSQQVTISPDRKDISITINVDEGEVFRLGEIRLAGEMVVDEAELRALIKLDSGDVVSRRSITDIVSAMQRRLSEDGYAFAEVRVLDEIAPDSRVVNVTFLVEPGKRMRIRFIKFSGNNETRDEVLRREMRQFEGEVYRRSKIDRSRVRLQRLNYIGSVDDQVDLEVTVTERFSGNLQLGIGYSQAQGVLLNLGFSHENIFGTGNSLGVNVDNSSSTTRYSFAYVNPYYTADGISRGFNFSFTETDASENNTSNYLIDRIKVSVDFGIPLSEFNRLNLEAGVLRNDLQIFDSSADEVIDFIVDNSDEYDASTPRSQIEGDAYDTLFGQFSLAKDTRNRRIFADSGYYNSINLEAHGGDLDFYKLRYQHRSAFAVTDGITLSLRARVGFGDGYGQSEELPFFERFTAGGVRSVRGYEFNSLGPLDSNNDPYGGTFQVITNTELLFPLEEAASSETLRLALYFDAGNVFGEPADYETDELRQSIGIALKWFTPVGPLEFSLANPINDRDGDDTQTFQFALGAAF